MFDCSAVNQLRSASSFSLKVYILICRNVSDSKSPLHSKSLHFSFICQVPERALLDEYPASVEQPSQKYFSEIIFIEIILRNIFRRNIFDRNIIHWNISCFLPDLLSILVLIPSQSHASVCNMVIGKVFLIGICIIKVQIISIHSYLR